MKIEVKPARPDDVNPRTFAEKVRKNLGRLPFAEDLVAAFFTMIDPKTPWSARAALAGALVYFITPFDLIPDFLPGIGFVDDAAVLATAVGFVGRAITDKHRQSAQIWLLKADPKTLTIEATRSHVRPGVHLAD